MLISNVLKKPVLGVVVIGRNEGDRLKKCLNSLVGLNDHIIYVDSGSTDGSVVFAESLGISVVKLDLSIPFTAGRARNAGFYELIKLFPHILYVQFVDGDCEVIESWLHRASIFLDAHADVAVVCGRNRERYPDASIYNYQCDIEWNTPVGENNSCGGIFLCRAQAFADIDGFNTTLIAGEEPEMCVRLRQNGWRILRLEEEMTLHDAAIFHFSQWWKRNVRSGYGYANGAYLHGHYPEMLWVKEMARAIFWGGFLPLMILIALALNQWVSLALFSLYFIQIIKLAYRGTSPEKKWQMACLLVISKFAECIGVTRFWKNRLFNQRGKLIEYKQ